MVAFSFLFREAPLTLIVKLVSWHWTLLAFACLLNSWSLLHFLVSNYKSALPQPHTCNKCYSWASVKGLRGRRCHSQIWSFEESIIKRYFQRCWQEKRELTRVCYQNLLELDGLTTSKTKEAKGGSREGQMISTWLWWRKQENKYPASLSITQYLLLLPPIGQTQLEARGQRSQKTTNSLKAARSQSMLEKDEEYLKEQTGDIPHKLLQIFSV